MRVKERTKRGMALFLAILMMFTYVDISGIEVHAAQEETSEITAFGEQDEAVEDNNGDRPVLGDDVQSPQISVQEGEDGVEPLEADGTIKITVTDSDGTVTEETCEDLGTYLSNSQNYGKYKNAKQVVIQLQEHDASLYNSPEEILNEDLGENIILDLNGYSLSTNGSFKMSKGKLTIQSSESGGIIQFSENVSFGITIGSGAECIVDAGVIIRGDAESATLFNSEGTCTIKKGATISNTSSEGDETDYCAWSYVKI